MLKDEKISFVFTDRHAYLQTAQFSEDLANLDWIIWETLQARDFRRDEDNIDKFDKYQAEALVYRRLPVKALKGIACYSGSVKSEIIEEANRHSVAVKIRQAHWRAPSKIEWIEEGLEDLKLVILENGIRSIAIPPLGAGNGGLDWKSVRDLIERSLNDLEDVEVILYEPVAEYQNVAKRAGLKKLTPARGLIAEIIRS